MISSPPGTEMFHFPGFAASPLCIHGGLTRRSCDHGWGCPIRISPVQSLLGSSPTLFVASHVLLRLLVPRHPPCALISLTFLHLAKSSSCQDLQNRFLFSTRFLLLRVCVTHSTPLQLSKIRTLARKNGADRARTDDFQLAKLALSQLSYSPDLPCFTWAR